MQRSKLVQDHVAQSKLIDEQFIFAQEPILWHLRFLLRLDHKYHVVITTANEFLQQPYACSKAHYLFQHLISFWEQNAYSVQSEETGNPGIY